MAEIRDKARKELISTTLKKESTKSTLYDSLRIQSLISDYKLTALTAPTLVKLIEETQTLLKNTLSLQGCIYFASSQADYLSPAIIADMKLASKPVIVKGKHFFSTGVEALDNAESISTIGMHVFNDQETFGYMIGWHSPLNPLNESDLLFFRRIVDILKRAIYRYRTEEKMKQKEKMGLISTLSAGISHEVNNPLSSIMACAQLALMQDGLPAATTELLELILTNVKRCSSIVSSIYKMSQNHSTKRAIVLVKEIIDNVKLLTEPHLYKKGIQFEITLKSPLDRIHVNQIDIEQILFNLIKNACEASNQNGVIILNCYQQNGTYFMEVTDFGIGIPPSNLNQIFNPFFTTKGEHGYGIGLTISSSMARNNGGDLTVTSEEGNGATFRLSFPVQG